MSTSQPDHVIQIISDLTVLSKLQPGQTLSTSTMTIIDHNTWSTSLWRTYSGENRTATVDFIKDKLTTAFVVYDTTRDSAILEQIPPALTGVANLKLTYRGDYYTIGKIDTIIQSVQAQLENFKKLGVSTEVVTEEVPVEMSSEDVPIVDPEVVEVVPEVVEDVTEVVKNVSEVVEVVPEVVEVVPEVVKNVSEVVDVVPEMVEDDSEEVHTVDSEEVSEEVHTVDSEEVSEDDSEGVPEDVLIVDSEITKVSEVVPKEIDVSATVFAETTPVEQFFEDNYPGLEGDRIWATEIEHNLTQIIAESPKLTQRKVSPKLTSTPLFTNSSSIWNAAPPSCQSHLTSISDTTYQWVDDEEDDDFIKKNRPQRFWNGPLGTQFPCDLSCGCNSGCNPCDMPYIGQCNFGECNFNPEWIHGQGSLCEHQCGIPFGFPCCDPPSSFPCAGSTVCEGIDYILDSWLEESISGNWDSEECGPELDLESQECPIFTSPGYQLAPSLENSIRSPEFLPPVPTTPPIIRLARAFRQWVQSMGSDDENDYESEIIFTI